MKQKRQQTGEHSPEKDWCKRLRDHLAGYEAPVPDDLWEKIEARLPKEVVSQTKKKEKKARIVTLWARWAAVAAVVVGGFVLWNENRHEADQTAAVLPLNRGSQRGSELAHSQAERKAEFEAEREAELVAVQTTPPNGTPPNLGGESCAPKEPTSSEEKPNLPI